MSVGDGSLVSRLHGSTLAQTVSNRRPADEVRDARAGDGHSPRGRQAKAHAVIATRCEKAVAAGSETVEE